MADGIQTVAFVLPNFQAGGAERVMVTVANHLDRSRFQPMIIAFDAAGSLRDIVAPDTPVISLSARRVSLGAPAFIQAVRKYKPDLLISTMAHLNIFVLLLKPFLAGTPVIVREAVTPSYFSGSLLKRAILTLGYYVLYPFADKILSPTQLVFDEMPGFLRQRKQKLCRLFNPVNTDFISDGIDPSLRQSLARPNQRLFVAAGRLVDQKGFDRLIEVLRSWSSRDDWRLIILGDGPDHQKLQQMIDAEGLQQIKLAGFESKPWRYFAVADAFLLPSRHEGLPNVALEALAIGTPVIASSSAGGIGEIADVCLPGSVELADNMERFLDKMDRVTVSDAAWPRKSLLPECFSLGTVVASYERIFTQSIADAS